VTDEVRGWKEKVHDKKRPLKPVERTSSVVGLLKRLEMSSIDFKTWKFAREDLKKESSAASESPTHNSTGPA
jgi:hypothetical protein